MVPTILFITRKHYICCNWKAILNPTLSPPDDYNSDDIEELSDDCCSFYLSMQYQRLIRSLNRQYNDVLKKTTKKNVSVPRDAKFIIALV